MDDVQITFDLEAKEALAKAEELKKHLEEIFTTDAGETLSDSIGKVSSELKDAYERIVNLVDKIKNFDGATVPTEKFRNLNAELISLGEEYNKIREKMWDMEDAGKTNTPQYTELIRQLQEVEAESTNVQNKLAELKKNNEAFELNPDAKAELSSYVNELAEANSELSKGVRQTETLSSVTANTGNLVSVNLTPALNSAAKSALKLVQNIGSLASSTLKRGINTLARSIFNIKKSSDSTNDSVKRGVKLFIKYAFGVRSFFFLYRRIRKAVTEGFGELAKYSGDLNGKISQISTSLLQLRNALTTAFAPILNYIAPAVVQFIDLLTKATTAVTQFFAALFGQTSFVRAKKVYKDYAKDLQKSEIAQQEKDAKAREKYEKNQEEKEKKRQQKRLKQLKKYQKQIMGFDDVNILKKPDEDDDSSSTSEPYSSSLKDKLPWEDYKNMFETVKVEERFKALADKIKGFFKNEDWEGLGKFLASGINKAFELADGLITSDKLQNRVHKIVDAITRTFNSLVDNINWPLIGKTFGDGINLIVNTINDLLTGIDWENLGSKIAEGLNSLQDTIDWFALGEVFANRFNAMIGVLYGVVTNFHWADLGTNLGNGINSLFLSVRWQELAVTLATLINGLFEALYNLSTTIRWSEIALTLTNALNTLVHTVDWARAGQAVSELFKGVLDFLVTAVENFDWEGFGKGIGDFIVNIDWLSIISGIFKLVLGVIAGLVEINMKILEAILHGAFVKLTEAITDYVKDKSAVDIIMGFYAGLINIYANVGKWVQEHIFNPFIKAIKSAFGISSPSKKMAEIGKSLIEGLYKGITDIIKSVGNWVKTNIFDKVMGALKSAFGIAGTIASKLTEIGSSIMEGIKSGANSGWTKSLSGALSDIASKMFSTLKKGSWSEIGQHICDGIEKGLKAGWKWLKETVRDLADSLFTAAKDFLGISSPSKLFRDKIGKMLPEGLALGIDKGASSAIASMNKLTSNLGNTSIQLPSLVSGNIIPYSVGKSDKEDVNSSLTKLLDMLQYNQSNGITLSELEEILITLFRQYMNIQFYLGDEQVARHANAGNARLDRRYNPSTT